ncbi:MAG TPA: NrfD/PsrC family molybdoenzyme membrane anchor subunit [Anaerolineae bacterium]|nr:NrfD/PsrC family molybdoenzyme membrane anchor subunit [Anaerolineae bacterium]
MAEHHWGWLIAIYLFLGGMGAGSFLIASVFELSGLRYRHKFCPTSMAGAGVSGPLILVGTVLLVLDLGAGLREPWRIPLMFTNFGSVMTWGIWILSLFLPLCFLYCLLELMQLHPGILAWARKRQGFLPKRWRLVPEALNYRRIKRVVCSAGAVLAVGTAVYTGVLLSVVKAVPFWNTPVLPALFFVSAISTGMGLTFDLAATLAVPELHRRYTAMPLVHMLFIGLEVLLLALLMFVAIDRGGEAAESARLILLGNGSVVFWVLVIGFGMVYPFMVHIYAFARHSHGFFSGVLSGAGIVIAGLFVRYLIVAAAIPLAL